MISHQFNPSLIRRNPSRKCDGFTQDHMENPSRNGESVHECVPSRRDGFGRT